MKQKLIAALIILFALAGRAATTIDSAHPYAYSANTGWINAIVKGTNGAVIGRDYCSGTMYGANIGWINLGDGTPDNHYAYENDYAGDFGVNHDGAEALRGYAWGANVGWIAFEEQGDPRVDLTTGNLSGYAWGANIGWISLSNAQAFVRTEQLDSGPDADEDGIPDAWEWRYLNTTRQLAGGDADYDGDGVPDVIEYGMDTDPRNSNDFLRMTLDEVGETINALSWPTRSTRHYQLQSTASLTDAWENAESGVLAGTGGNLNIVDVPSINSPALFYRVNAILPLE